MFWLDSLNGESVNFETSTYKAQHTTEKGRHVFTLRARFESVATDQHCYTEFMNKSDCDYNKQTARY